jgi:phospholipase C
MEMNFISRYDQSLLPARPNINAVPVPERIGEPSVFKHVVYIIKENKTYDQVLGDVNIGNGRKNLCVFGENITPNMHALTNQFGMLDNYYASGKSSAEGHQWTDAAMVSDYVEKNVRSWYRSYPHRQEDALVYNKSGFIWNNALDHGKKVRIYGEACETVYDKNLKWLDIYNKYKTGQPAEWHNTSTIARILPIISPDFPDCDNIAFNDQQRADVFIKEWKNYELGDSLPDLMILSLPNDHSAGTSPDFPTPNAMVADNDLALGRIVDMISKSKYWDSTVVFVTQDDSQGGWDHISAYRTVGAVISPYSSGKLVSTNYNQTSMVRSIEQILGLPPMNVIDATAKPMADCFTTVKNAAVYNFKPNNIPLDQMNQPLKTLTGLSKKFAKQSMYEVFNEVDGGEDDKMNRIIWFYSKGKEKYPGGRGK